MYALQKLSTGPPQGPATPLWNIPEGSEDSIQHRYLHSHVHRCTIHTAAEKLSQVRCSSTGGWRKQCLTSICGPFHLRFVLSSPLLAEPLSPTRVGVAYLLKVMFSRIASTNCTHLAKFQLGSIKVKLKFQYSTHTCMHFKCLRVACHL